MMRKSVFKFLFKRVAQTRAPDQVISGEAGVEDPYLYRWYVIPRNPVFNIYLHRFCRSDDDRALHDHPWWNVSWLLEGDYQEEVPADPKNPSGARDTIDRFEGAVVFRFAKQAHRVLLWNTMDLVEIPVWTLFVTGPRFRKWGFHTPEGWLWWRKYLERYGEQ